MTIDEALKNAARVLEKAEDAPPTVAEGLNKTASAWLEMASLLMARQRV
jgi:hypothetical protein